MNSRDLYRRVLQGSQDSSPQLSHAGEMSPMSSLAMSFHHSTVLVSTPCKRLSLSSVSSTSSDTPIYPHNLSGLTDGSCCDNSNSSISDPSPSRFDESPIMSPNRSPNLISPSRRRQSCDKENLPTPYYSPSRSMFASHHRHSPLKDVQNTVNRNLTFSPLKNHVTPLKKHLKSPRKLSTPEDIDTTSQDSGYSESGRKFSDLKMDSECFSIPVACAPRRLNLDMSPPRSFVSPRKDTFGRKQRSFASLQAPSDEDDLLDLLEDNSTQDCENSPMASLFTAPIHPASAGVTGTTTTFSIIRRAKPDTPTSPVESFQKLPIRRCLSMIDTTPTSHRMSIKIPTPPSLEASFKRPRPPAEVSQSLENKRRKQDGRMFEPSALFKDPSTTASPQTIQTTQQSTNVISKPVRPLTAMRQLSAPELADNHEVKQKIIRSHSESHVSIMKALNKSFNNNQVLTGDFSREIALPLIEGGKHADLKSISVDTMADVVRGKYKNINAQILDCRYPYEYDGGHINNGVNWHHPQMVLDCINSQKCPPVIPSEDTKRDILIFHCEFSAERGPKAQRMLRNQDRTASKEHYPALHFPETYLLEGGYKAFYESYPELCTPKSYVTMLDSQFSQDLKFFRAKSKSWVIDTKQIKGRGLAYKSGPKRLGL